MSEAVRFIAMPDDKHDEVQGVDVEERNDVEPDAVIPWWHHFIGISLALLASFLMQALASTLKLLTRQYEPVQVLNIHNVILLAMFTAGLVSRRVNPLAKQILSRHGSHLALYAVFCTSAFLMAVISLSIIPLGQAASLASTTPVFVVVMSRLVLGERLNLFYVVAMLCTVAGLTIIGVPEFLVVDTDLRSHRLLGIGAGLGNAAATAGGFIMLRRIRAVDPLVVGFYLAIVSCVVYGLINAYVALTSTDSVAWPDRASDLLWFLLCSTIGMAYLIANAASFKWEVAAVCSMVRTVGLVWAFLLEVLVFGTAPSPIVICGAALIAASIVLISVYKLRVVRHDAARPTISTTQLTTIQRTTA